MKFVLLLSLSNSLSRGHAREVLSDLVMHMDKGGINVC